MLLSNEGHSLMPDENHAELSSASVGRRKLMTPDRLRMLESA